MVAWAAAWVAILALHFTSPRAIAHRLDAAATEQPGGCRSPEADAGPARLSSTHEPQPRSSLMNFLKRCWRRRWIRGLAWTAVTLVTLYALLCAWVNWSGARQWSATQAMLKAEGETLDFRATMNDPIPEAENFCAIPSAEGSRAHRGQRRIEKARPRKSASGSKHSSSIGEQGWRAPEARECGLGKTRRISRPGPTGCARKARFPCQRIPAMPRAMCSAALAKHDAVVQELAAGLNRPQAQWTPEWKTRELPAILLRHRVAALLGGAGLESRCWHCAPSPPHGRVTRQRRRKQR